MNNPKEKYYPQQRLYHKIWWQNRGKEWEGDYRLTTKIETLTHYGKGKCACVMCGESRPACLTIDHINGGGKRHRAELGRKGGYKFYYWLRQQNFPTGYQTLCMNCQFVKMILDKSKRMPE